MAPGLPHLLAGIRAAADPCRLRLLAVCSQGEWTVSELVGVIGQSQPCVSRHLKILAGAGLLERFREGGWVFHRRASGDGEGARLARSLCALLPDGDPALELDRRRLDAVREARRREAGRYFDDRAAGWDSERDLAVDGAVVEDALHGLFERLRPTSLLDVGTGTGRVLQVLARHIGFGLGVDVSRDMLKVARANLDQHAEARHCQVRHGDMYALPLPDAEFAAVTLHQVLHFADDPARVLAEAARVLAPGGRLVVVDLAGHGVERLREERAHRRLGFGAAEMSAWLAELGLAEEPARSLPGSELTVVIWTARRPRSAGGGDIDEDETTTATPGRAAA